MQSVAALLANVILVLAAADSAEQPFPTLKSLATAHDAVAIVRVEETNYDYVRGFPRSGFALLRVLIGYKGVKSGDLLEVTQDGLADDACYYPKLALTQVEGRRYLAFLNRKGKDSYEGRSPHCRLPVLVTADAGYALLFPPPDVSIADDSVATELTFADPAAFVDASDLTQRQLNELTQSFQAQKVERERFLPESETYVYTRGIPLPALRSLMKEGLGEPQPRR